MAGTNYNAPFNNEVNISLTNDDRLATTAECNGNPNVVALQANVYAVGCEMKRTDLSFGNVLYENTGTVGVPIWTLLGGGGGGGVVLGGPQTGFTAGEFQYISQAGTQGGDVLAIRNSTTNETLIGQAQLNGQTVFLAETINLLPFPFAGAIRSDNTTVSLFGVADLSGSGGPLSATLQQVDDLAGNITIGIQSLHRVHYRTLDFNNNGSEFDLTDGVGARSLFGSTDVTGGTGFTGITANVNSGLPFVNVTVGAISFVNIDSATRSLIFQNGTHYNFGGLQNLLNNAAAIGAGLNVGDLYYTNVAGDGILKVRI